jgi:hypothetical protein
MGKSLSNSITAVIALDNQGKPTENSIHIIRKQRCAVQKYMLKTHRRQKSWWQRSQGGVQLPTGGNCA